MTDQNRDQTQGNAAKTNKPRVSIRRIRKVEYPLLTDFLYHAIFVPSGAEPLAREVIEQPEVAIYVDGFGTSKGDCGLVAVQNGQIVGAAWARIIPAFGHIDDKTPELVIAVLPEYRNQGIGTKLLKTLFRVVADSGFKQISLAVKKENPALRFYERLGYKTVRENDEDFIMARELKDETRARDVAAGGVLGIGLGTVAAVITDNWSWVAIGLCVGVALASAWFAFDWGKRKPLR